MDTQIKVRGYHTDLYQHVNNARYLEFLEEARWQLLEDHMDLESFMRGGYLFFVVNINISYRSPARVGDTVTVRSGLKKIGNKSAVIRQQIINKATGTMCVDADVTFVIADTGGRPLKLEADLKDKVMQIPLFEE
ncbi:acyl-CoA thioesterase [Desulfotignum phosphitoxidans]|uniref:Long-chain acyl-CoA thioesterase TesC n=1 Tax=Desulfotignum phosphitoxidans DSM 13687 TaxID=1286635 RepID=S0G7M4_9BACT|nr:thioesterase family protein [Desulfotignum phosphitoxidans]EMS81031.1 long-chain acyl-CoA thioesterase TesC [Desulfotignum phosphitoxidans DSM 13687]